MFGDTAIASEDGSEVWIFDASGRHLHLDGLLVSQLYEFGYDAEGRFVRAGPRRPNTYVDRDAAGSRGPSSRRTGAGRGSR